jgi:hypothetical protein
VINAPIDEVIATLTQTAFPFDEAPYRGDLSLIDPAFTRTDVVLGQKLKVRYTFYAVPGGTQVDTLIEGISDRPADPVLIRAVRRAGEHVEGEIATARDRLE